jgi:hypothetical protein
MNAKTMSAAMAVALLAGTMAGAAEEPQEWKFEITPYAWLAGMEGDITVNGTTVDFEKSFTDLVDAVELGVSLRIGAEYDRFLVGAMVDYFSMSTDKMDVEDRPEGGSLDTKLLLTEAALGYRVDGWSEGQSFGLMVGVRNLHMETDLEVFGHGKVSKEKDVTDAMFYVLPSIPVFPSKIEGLRFNPVLGIGAGDSDLVFELFPQFQYQINDNMSARIGYRTAGWKFEGEHNEDNELNFRLAGFVLGLGMTF